MPAPPPRTATLATRPSSLAISIYPPFAYDATGGGARGGRLGPPGGGGGGGTLPPGATRLEFDAGRVAIPPLDWRTTRFLGLPLPPGLRIDIVPSRLDGWVDEASGAVSLAFDADFKFTAFGLYAPPAIRVATVLTTGDARGARLRGTGAPRDPATGAVRLAGVAAVAPTGDRVLDAFLRAPSECLAVLDGELAFVE